MPNINENFKSQESSKIEITPYQDEKEEIIKLIEELQDYLINLDPLKHLRRLPEYGSIYIENLLQKIKANNGMIYLAKEGDVAIGMIAGIIEEQTQNDKIEAVPLKTGRILELIVSEKSRGQNIGTELIEKIQQHFKGQGCNVIRVEVFEPNIKTHGFYKKHGYQDRAIDMLKKI